MRADPLDPLLLWLCAKNARAPPPHLQGFRPIPKYHQHRFYSSRTGGCFTMIVFSAMLAYVISTIDFAVIVSLDNRQWQRTVHDLKARELVFRSLGRGGTLHKHGVDSARKLRSRRHTVVARLLEHRLHIRCTETKLFHVGEDAALLVLCERIR